MSLQNGFFKTQSSNPVLPPEEWTLVYENTTPGSYSTTLGWGKYKVVLSGAGGSGGAAASGKYSNQNYADAGEAGKLLTGYTNVLHDTTSTISGVIGSGGKASSAFGNDTTQGSYTVGAAGTGAVNGVQGTGQVKNTYQSGYTSAGAAGGSGGGATSASGIGTAAGGRGGNCRALNSATPVSQVAVGTGGAGGTGSNEGDGAPGGAGKFAHATTATSSNGSDGYVRIYKSNIYPEPL